MANPINRDPAMLRQRAQRRWGHPDRWQCVYCGRHRRDFNYKPLQVDHFYPYIASRNSFGRNLVPACPECNTAKRDRDPILWMEAVGVPKYIRSMLIDAHEHDKWRRPAFLILPQTALDYAAGTALPALKRPIQGSLGQFQGS